MAAAASQPFHDRDGWVWFDGVMVPQRDAKVHVLSHALHYASSVFEGERAYNGTIFRGHDHSERLIRSGKLLGFDVPATAEEIDQAKRDVMNKMGLESCYIRTLAWRGSEQLGVSCKGNTIHLAVAAWEWGDYYADKSKGIRMMIASRPVRVGGVPNLDHRGTAEFPAPYHERVFE